MPSLNSIKSKPRESRSLIIAILILLLALPGLLSIVTRRVTAQTRDNKVGEQIAAIPPGQAYRQTNLVSDIPGLAPVLDLLLVNPWGMTETSSSPFWVANNGTGSSTLYKGDVSGSPFVKNSGLAGITIPCGLPTGAVASTSSDFVVTGGAASGPARFIFATLTGRIVGWNPNVPVAGSTAAQIAFGPALCSSFNGHSYTGLAIGTSGGNNFLYAADFASPMLPGSINVFDKNYALQSTASFPFVDTGVPAIPSDFRPFNITNIGGFLYVSYAKRDPGTGRVVNGPGLGFVSKFNTDGTFVQRIVSGNEATETEIDAPWGMTIAPAPFGIYGGALLVGNFSDNGIINAYSATSGTFLGTLKDESGNNIVNDQLWALQFGNGGSNGGGNSNTLYFTAGIVDEQHGLLGKLNPTTQTATSLIQFATDTFGIGEGSGHVDITVTRAGDASGTATINYNTFDGTGEAGNANQKADYEIAEGTLTFGPGETSKTFRILITDDKFVEGDEVVNLVLSNPTGTGVGLGDPHIAQLTIHDNDASPPTANPIDDAQFFVRQHFLDFLNREPDAATFNSFVNQITACGSDTACISAKRVAVSTNFFNSAEFQTGMVSYLTNRAAFGTTPGAASFGSPAPLLYGQFERDLQTLERNFINGGPGADAQLEANKQAYFSEFITRPEFAAAHDTQTNAQYVDSLLANAGIAPSDFVVNLTNSQEVPPTNPTVSGGGTRPRSYGTARFQINSAETAMTMTATVNNVDITGAQTADANDNLVAAHIHAGASVAPGVNGPVVWGFFGSPFNDNNPDDHVVTPFASGAGGTFTDKWDAPEGNGTTLTAQLPNIRAGRAYINFHTTQFPGGEIRGNFPATQSFRDTLLNGLNASTETRASVLRKIAESQAFAQAEFNRAFITLEFFAYFRRDPDPISFNLLLNRLNSFGGDTSLANMVRNFITAQEYRQRFGLDPSGPSTPFLTNSAPTAGTDTATTNSVTPILINVLGNDSDPEGDFLTITNVTPGAGGTPAINPGNRSVSFTPSGSPGVYTFQYTITDNGMSYTGGSFPGTPDPKSATGTVTVTVTSAGTVQLSSGTYSVAESAGRVTITVQRSGDLTVPASVDYTTSDTAGLVPCSTVAGVASSRCDYETASGTLSFAANESSKTFDIFIVDDSFAEGAETFTLTLSNPKGTNFSLATPFSAVVTITDNDASTGANPISGVAFFVRQHYIDFLNREPDPPGFAGWQSILNNCAPGNTACDRVSVSSDFYLSNEFQVRGYFIYRFYRAALGRNPTYKEFLMDLSRVTGFLTDAQLEANKLAFIADFMTRTEFVTKYGSVTDPTAYVKALEQAAGVTLSNEQALITGLQSSTETRATVLRKFVESNEVATKFFNEAFVVEAYFGYLRRDPDASFQTWIQILNQNNDRRALVSGFVNSNEYVQRFGP